MFLQLDCDILGCQGLFFLPDQGNTPSWYQLSITDDYLTWSFFILESCAPIDTLSYQMKLKVLFLFFFFFFGLLFCNEE